VSAISPNTGTANGGTAVTVTGAGFLSERRDDRRHDGDGRDRGEQHVD